MVRGSILLLLFVALLGCQPESDSIRIGSNRWLGYAPIYLADDLGWTAPSGIRLVEYPNTTGVLRGFRNGMLDAAMLTLDETLLLQDSAAELDLEIILVTNVSAGADALFARAPLTNLKDLAGQRIGVENTALGAYFLSRVLDQAGLRIDDLQVVSLPVHEQTAAFAAGDVDAVITFASEGPALESKGARRIFDSRQLPAARRDRRRTGGRPATRHPRAAPAPPGPLVRRAAHLAGQSRRNRSAPACAPGPDADGIAGHPRRLVDG